MTVLSEDTLHIQKKTRDREKHFPMETVARKNFPRTGRNLWQNQTRWGPGGRRETGEEEIRERRGGDGKTGRIEGAVSRSSRTQAGPWKRLWIQQQDQASAGWE